MSEQLTEERLTDMIEDAAEGLARFRAMYPDERDELTDSGERLAAYMELRQLRARIAELERDLRVAQTASTLGQPRYRVGDVVGDRVWVSRESAKQMFAHYKCPGCDPCAEAQRELVAALSDPDRASAEAAVGEVKP